MEHYVITTCIGELVLSIRNSQLHRLWLPAESATFPAAPGSPLLPPSTCPLAREAAEQIHAYLAGALRRFTLPLEPCSGTPLQQKIRLSLEGIPYGHTKTYGELGPARAVARVCSQNPLPLLIPCHRVIPAGAHAGQPGHYRGGTALKRWLLLREAASA